MRGARPLALLAVVALVAAVPACSDDGPGEGEARLEVDGLAIVERDGERERVDDSASLHPGDRVEITEGIGRLQLRDGVRMELRAGLGDADRSVLRMGEVPVLESGDLLVAAPGVTTVEAAGSTVDVAGGAAQVSRRLGVGVAAYDASVQLDSAGQQREIPALRQMQVPALGRPPRSARPLAYDEADPWDRRYLGSAIDLGHRLEAMAASYTANLPPDEGRTPGFFRLVLPGLGDDPELTELVTPDRPTGETLIGAAIVDLGQEGSFAERWRSVFGFRDQGAEWGLVALDQEVSSTPLLGSIEQAIGSSPLGFVDEVALPPSTSTTDGASTGGAGSDGATTTSGAPPSSSSTRPPPTSAPPGTTEPPPTTSPPAGDEQEPIVPEITPVIEPVTDLVGGLLDGLLDPPGP